MANPLQIANKSQLIEERTRLILQELLKRYKQGEIKTEAELQYLLIRALEDLYTKVGKPTMQQRLAWGAPSSADYNDTMNEVYNDVQTLFTESKAMEAAIQESFEQVELERQILSWQTNDIKDRLQDIQLKMEQENGEAIFRESFLNKDNMDSDMAVLTLAAVNTNEGALTLNQIEAEQFQTDATVRILEGNGLTGNTHQVRALDGSYRFYGQDNMHIDLVTVLDGNRDTWVEYETFSVSDEVLEATNGYGFEYKEGIKWIKETNDSLRLLIEIELPITEKINWFTLAPFLPSDKGAAPAIVRNIIVYDGKGSAVEIAKGGEVLDEDKIFIFPRQNCKRVHILIEQPSSYETLVGHFFFKELEETSVNYLANDKEQSGRRIDGDKPSIDNLLYGYNPATKQIIQPERTGPESLIDNEEIKNNLFLTPDTNGQVQAGLEALTAKRFMIGLKDTEIASYRFSIQSEYVSVAFETEDNITAIYLNADHVIPKEMGNGNWIQYFISIDDGRNWKEIAPRGSTKEGAKVQYLINQSIPQEGRFDNYGYIDTMEPVKSVRLKIVLSRPTNIVDAEYYTPIIHDYKLHCKTTKGDF